MLPTRFFSTFEQAQVRSVMFPVTVVNRFLNRHTPQVPLPPNIDEEYDSHSESWLVVSKSQNSLHGTQAQPTSSVACQTSSFSETTKNRPRSQIRSDLRSETISMMNRMHCLHQVSNLDPSSRSYITVDSLNHIYIASLPPQSPWSTLDLHHHSNFLELQQNPFLHHQDFITETPFH